MERSVKRVRRLTPFERFLEEQPDIAKSIFKTYVTPRDVLTACAAAKTIFKFCDEKDVLEGLYESPLGGLLVADDLQSLDLIKWFGKKVGNPMLKQITKGLRWVVARVVLDNDRFARLAACGSIDDVKTVLPFVDPSANHYEALYAAIKNEHFTVANLILQDPRIDKSVLSNASLIIASQQTNFVLVEMLLNDPNASPTIDVLLAAVKGGCCRLVKRILEDPRVDPRGGNIIEIAATHGHVDVVKLLLEDPRIVPCENALSIAVRYSHASVVEQLLTDDRLNPSFTVLENAIGYGRREIVELFITNERFSCHAEALHKAVMSRNNHAIKLLLELEQTNPNFDYPSRMTTEIKLMLASDHRTTTENVIKLMR